MGILRKLIDSEYKELCRFEKMAKEVEALDEEMQALSDEDLKNKTAEFKAMLEEGKTIDDIAVPAFAVAREACARKIGEKPFHVQLVGGFATHYGNIAELKTGEGKTLTTVLPAYLNALEGKGVHVVTTNEYLSTRNAEWMRPVYEALGVTVGVNLNNMSLPDKQKAYACDITYSTNSEVGFDYLRDNMVLKKEHKVLRGLNYCIIDEIDSILIDEARTPLIISGGGRTSVDEYTKADKIAKKLKDEEDYTVDLKTKNVSLTEAGSKKVEAFLGVDNLYAVNNAKQVHHINLAIRANYGFKKDVDYVVQNNEIIIVDSFTGRLMEGRQFTDGLHQAIEAKEGVPINIEAETAASITFQNLFRMYKKLSGMTGTAKTEEEEFRNIYNMYVIRIPTNKPVIRDDLPDLVYCNEKGKLKALVDTIKFIHEEGRPILIGTISVESNEKISKLLTKAGLKHEVLNAKNHAREAEIIAKAGEKGAITLATNMAGRGTDIKLTDEVKELGGLYVIGTERHESRRIDNQLRGRSGRQGDPGTSQFFVSFDDDLMKKFGSEKMKKVLKTMGFPEDQAIRSKSFTKSIEAAQKKVEGNNFDIRKNLLDFDNVLNEQREIIYSRRNEIMDQDNIHDKVVEIFKNTVTNLVESHIPPENHLTENDIEDIVSYVNTNFLKNHVLKIEDIDGKSPDEIIDFLFDMILKDYEKKMIISPLMHDVEKKLALVIIDRNWIAHMNAMEHLKEGIGLRGYSQINPIQAYTMEGYEMFDKLLADIDAEIASFLLKIDVRQEIKPPRPTKAQKLNANDGKEKVKAKPQVNKNKIGRNDPCPCGSGKKYKNCCGK